MQHGEEWKILEVRDKGRKIVEVRGEERLTVPIEVLERGGRLTFIMFRNIHTRRFGS